MFGPMYQKCSMCGTWCDDGHRIGSGDAQEFVCIECGDHYLEAHELKMRADSIVAELGQMIDDLDSLKNPTD